MLKTVQRTLFFCRKVGPAREGLFEKAFRNQYANLVRQIDVEHGLWTELKHRDVLTDRQIRVCQAEVCYK